MHSSARDSRSLFQLKQKVRSSSPEMWRQEGGQRRNSVYPQMLSPHVLSLHGQEEQIHQEMKVEWDVPTKVRNMKLDNTLTGSLYPGQSLKEITFPQSPLMLGHCFYPGSHTTGVIPLGYTADMGTCVFRCQTVPILFPGKKGLGEGGKLCSLMLTMITLSWISFPFCFRYTFLNFSIIRNPFCYFLSTDPML